MYTVYIYIYNVYIYIYIYVYIYMYIYEIQYISTICVEKSQTCWDFMGLPGCVHVKFTTASQNETMVDWQSAVDRP